MAGSPLKRQRKLGIRPEDDSVIPFPYMLRVADLAPGWRYFTTAEKIEHLIGLDRCDRSSRGGLSQSSTRSASRFRCR